MPLRVRCWISLVEVALGGWFLINFDRTILAAAKLQRVPLKYGVNDTVYAQGAPAQFVYVVEQGALRRSRLYQGYKKSILQFLLPGDSFGFEAGRYHLDSVQALAHAKVLAVGREALMDAARSNARLSKMLLDAAVRALVAAEEQAIVLREASSTERLALFLLDLDARLNGQIYLPMTRTNIANHLGLTEETVSRTFTALRRAKVLQYDNRRRSIAISDKRRLKQLATDASDFDCWSTLKRPKAQAALTAAPTLQ
jgi:CRP/FNR family transcriptional regulator, nitrogen fixation regulation protein